MYVYNWLYKCVCVGISVVYKCMCVLVERILDVLDYRGLVGRLDDFLCVICEE